MWMHLSCKQYRLIKTVRQTTKFGWQWVPGHRAHNRESPAAERNPPTSRYCQTWLAVGKRGISVLKPCLECMSSFNTPLSNSRLWCEHVWHSFCIEQHVSNWQPCSLLYILVDEWISVSLLNICRQFLKFEIVFLVLNFVSYFYILCCCAIVET